MNDFRKALEEVNAGRLPRKEGYCQIPTTIFVAKVDVNMPAIPDVSFFSFVNDQPELIKKQGSNYSPLALSNHETVWIRESELLKLKSYAETLLTHPSSSVAYEGRMQSLRSSAVLIVEDLFENPSPENVDRCSKVVSSFVYVLMKDPKAYLFLAKLSSHDPYTLQHSVGTAVLCIILARKMGINSEEDLKEVGMAGLLHDVGKVKVKREIINKNGPLDELEWEEMRQHSLEGYEIVKDNPNLTERTKRAILEHHEDKNGTGYPLALRADETHIFSKIVCLCDIFNAITTERSYSKALAPFDAFKLIKEKLYHKVDEELFRQLVLIYGGKLEDF